MFWKISVGPRTLVSHFFQVPDTVSIYRHPSRSISNSKKWPLPHVWHHIEWTRCRRAIPFVSGDRYDLFGYCQNIIWEKKCIRKFFQAIHVPQIVFKISPFEGSCSTIALKWVSISEFRHVDTFATVAIDLSVVRPFRLLSRTTFVPRIIKNNHNGSWWCLENFLEPLEARHVVFKNSFFNDIQGRRPLR